jgi:ribonucleoside-diphosphate reductase alpha chain
MLSSYQLEILKSRYLLPNESTWEDCIKRVCTHIIKAETNGKAQEWKEKFIEMLSPMDFIPAGRILYGAGRKNGAMINCFALDVEDNRYSIAKFMGDSYLIGVSGGGLGYNISKIRPKGAAINGIDGLAPGAVSEIKKINAIGEQVKCGGSRRTALLAALSVSHPDLLEFLDVKLNRHELNNHNISVMINSDFIKAVRKDKPWQFEFGGRPYGNPISAKEIWNKLITNAIECGEPGIQFRDTIERNFATKYFESFTSSNPCQPKDSIILDNKCLKRIDSIGNTWNSWKTGTKEVLELTINNGLKVRFTPEHKIQAQDDSWVLAKDSLGIPLKWGLGNRKIKEIDPRTELLGFLFGDGFICANRTGIAVKINTEKEREVCGILLSWGFVKEKSGSFYINRKNFPDANFLDSRTFIRNLPDNILYGSSDISGSFLRGLFEANGSVNNHGQISLKATCGEMVDSVQLLLASFGIPSWKTTNNPKEVSWKNGTYTSRQSFNLQIAPRNAWNFKERIGFISEYKNDKIKKFNRKYATKLKVISIRSLGEMEVWDYQMKESPHYNLCQGIVARNCGEVMLPNFGSCLLGSINLSNMYNPTTNDVDWKKLSSTIYMAIRFLDDVLSINLYPLPECKTTAENSRRLGLGILGLHYLLIKLEYRYGKPKSIEFIERLFTTIRNEAFEASISLAEEKGAFQKFDFDSYINNDFISKLPPRILRKIKKYGIRNACLLSIAPSGTISQISNVSSGIEPIFSPIYTRKYRFNDEIKEEMIVDPLLAQYYTENKLLTNFVGAYDISPEEHLSVQSAIQQFVDGSISKTINVSKEYNKYNELSEIIFEHSNYLKGLTIYRAESRGEEPLTEIKFDGKREILEKSIQKAKNINLKIKEDTCKSGVCDL